MALDRSPGLGARMQSIADAFIQSTTEFTDSVSKFFQSESSKVSKEANTFLTEWSSVFADKREEEKIESKTPIG